MAMQLPLATCGACFLAYVLPYIPWPISSVLAAGICYFNYIHFSCILLLSINRFSYVFFQLAYETVSQQHRINSKDAADLENSTQLRLLDHGSLADYSCWA